MSARAVRSRVENGACGERNAKVRSRTMRKFCKRLSALLRDEQGMETVEWGVMAALIVAALVVAIGTLGTNVLNKFNGLVTATQGP
jgi:Flp pilus assembly pilin Flp